MQLDIAKYRPFVDQFDMSEERKIELINVVSDMMRSFVDLAFGDAPEQILLGIDRWKGTSAASDTLDSEPDTTITSTFNDAADGKAAGKSSP